MAAGHYEIGRKVLVQIIECGEWFLATVTQDQPLRVRLVEPHPVMAGCDFPPERIRVVATNYAVNK